MGLWPPSPPEKVKVKMMVSESLGRGWKCFFFETNLKMGLHAKRSVREAATKIAEVELMTLPPKPQQHLTLTCVVRQAVGGVGSTHQEWGDVEKSQRSSARAQAGWKTDSRASCQLVASGCDCVDIREHLFLCGTPSP